MSRTLSKIMKAKIINYHYQTNEQTDIFKVEDDIFSNQHINFEEQKFSLFKASNNTDKQFL